MWYGRWQCGSRPCWPRLKHSCSAKEEEYIFFIEQNVAQLPSFPIMIQKLSWFAVFDLHSVVGRWKFRRLQWRFTCLNGGPWESRVKMMRHNYLRCLTWLHPHKDLQVPSTAYGVPVNCWSNTNRGLRGCHVNRLVLVRVQITSEYTPTS